MFSEILFFLHFRRVRNGNRGCVGKFQQCYLSVVTESDVRLAIIERCCSNFWTGVFKGTREPFCAI
jgi:hypothetical protein